MKHLKSIAAELGLLFLLVAMAPILTAYFVANNIFSHAIQQEKSAALDAIADSAQRRVEFYVLGLIHDVTTLAKFPDLVKLLKAPQHIVKPSDAVFDFLSAFTLEKGYYDLLLIDLHGDIRFSLKREKDLGQNIYGEALKGTQLVQIIDAADTLLQTEVSNFSYYHPSNGHAAFLAAPVFEQGVIVGNVVLQIENRELNAIVNRYGGLGESGEIIVAAHENDRLIITLPTRHDDVLPTRQIDQERFSPLLKALRGEPGAGEYHDYRGQQTLAVWRYLPSLNWGMLVKIDTHELYAPIQRFKKVSFLVMSGSILLVVLGIIFSNIIVSRPIVRLAQAVSTLKEENLPNTIHVPARHEISNLVSAFNTLITSIRSHQLKLEERVAQRTSELVEAKLRTEDALTRQQEMQDELVQADKMAALGSLVAGVAHEINTPVGITLGSATYLEAETDKADDRYQAGEMTEDELSSYFATARQATQLMALNSKRASDLIQSFKQVAVDQAGGERRQFGLATYIDEVLLSLRPSLKKTHVEVIVKCPQELVVDSLPGSLSQVLTNLIMNSLTHAFTPEQTGHISIVVQQWGAQGEWVELIYSDDGKGIPSELHDKVFEPFFTTRRGAGGSGLGLHIVFNIVNQILKGMVKLSSVAGEGAVFTLRFPRILPN